MYNIDEKFIKDLLKDYARTMVCRLCKQVETLEVQKDLIEVQKLNILKSFHRESIYETFRDLEKQIKSYQIGQTFTKFKVYSPTDSK